MNIILLVIAVLVIILEAKLLYTSYSKAPIIKYLNKDLDIFVEEKDLSKFETNLSYSIFIDILLLLAIFIIISK